MARSKKRVLLQGFSIGLTAILIWTWWASVHSTQAFAYSIEVTFPTDTNTAKGGGSVYYSRSATLTPSLSANDLQAFYTANNIDVNQVDSITITPPSGVSGTATCSSPTNCTFGSVSGTELDVTMEGKYEDNGYFDWWRNNPGTRGYWWSYDLNGGTHYGTVEQGLIDQGNFSSQIAPRDFPGGTYYDLWGGDEKPINLSGYTFGGGGVSGLLSNYVVLNGADVTGSEFSTVDQNSINVNASAFRVSFYTTNGAFESSTRHEIRSPDNPRGLSWDYSISVTGKGYTYTYPSSWTINVTMKSQSPSPSPASPSPTATPAPKPTGDFDILPSIINFREPFKLKPKNFTIPNGCTYQGHVFKLSNGSAWTSPNQTGQTQELTFAYGGLYPAPVSVGSVTVSMQITASCGQSDWTSHTLTVNGPTMNNPPYFKLGWFNEGDWSSIAPVTKIVQGNKLMVRIVEDPNSNPVSPSDPDGDDFSLTGWDFSNGGNWVQTLPGKYGFHPLSNYLNGITMDTLGYHTIYATLTDEFGKSYTAGAMVEVVPPNPVAACTLTPDYVKSGRPYPDTAFSGKDSYSPLGRQITEYIWGNKKTSYTNNTSSPIYETVTLHVKDSSGLQSLTPGSCQLRVDPDVPPVAKLGVPSVGLRNKTVQIYNQSASIDGDVIASVEYKYMYDGNNNGFADDAWINLTGDLTKAAFTPTKVGKYKFYIKATENYGSWDDNTSDAESAVTLDVTNLAPSVSFTVEGKNEQPVVSAPTTFSAAQMIGWNKTKVNSTSSISANHWYVLNGSLYAGMGKGYERQYPFTYSYNDYYNGEMRGALFLPFLDHGFGVNSLSPYRGMKSAATDKSQPLLIPDDGSLTTQYGKVVIPSASEIALRSNKTHLLFPFNGKFYGLNKSKIGRYQSETVVNGNYITDLKHHWLDGNPYDFIISPTLTTNKTVPRVIFPTFDDYRVWDESKMTPTIGTVAPEAPEILGYEVSDRTIYQVIKWFLPNAVYSGVDLSAYGLEIRSYDIFSGQLISSTFDTTGLIMMPQSYPVQMIGYQDDLYITSQQYVSYSPSYRYGTLVRKINRSGLVQKTMIPEPASYSEMNGDDTYYCTPQNSVWYKGVKGDLYRYQQTLCNHSEWLDYAKESFLEKFDLNTMTAKWKAKLSGRYFRYPEINQFSSSGNVYDSRESLVVNPIKGEVLTRTEHKYDTVNMDTGAIMPFAGYVTTVDGAFGDINNYRHGTNFYVDEYGNYRRQPLRYNNNDSGSAMVTKDGLRTFFQWPWADYTSELTRVSRWPGDEYGQWSGTGGVLWMSSFGAQFANQQVFGGYFGDGLFVGIYNTIASGNQNYDYAVWLHPGTPSDLPAIYDGYELGQFSSPNSWSDVELSFSLKMDRPEVDPDKLAGFSFRMTDPRNRYAVETDGSTLYLSKYVNGTRTVLNQQGYPFQNGQSYSITVSSVGSSINISLDGIPYLSATDTTFSSGKIGPFTDKSYVSFGGVSIKNTPPPNVEWLTNYAVWESGTGSASVRYPSITFTDPENDPRAGSDVWTFSHTPKFLNNGGTSSLHGQTQYSSVVQFDRVGVYDITLQAQDDPHPDYRWSSMVFDGYRKSSNPYMQKLIVHRRPIAQFTLSVDGSGKVVWNDTSYDPDRYDNGTGACSGPDTPGIDYCASRGIVTREYSYITPSGVFVNRKLVTPAEPGEYKVNLKVIDEYGAESVPLEKTIYIGTPIPVNNLPVATLTYPTGAAYSIPTLENSFRPVIRWNQTDPDPGTVFKMYNVRIMEYSETAADKIGPVVAGTGGEASQNTSSTTQAWTVNEDLARGRKYAVQVQVGDGLEPSAWSTVGWMVINSKPSVTITYPAGTESNYTLIYSNKRPTIYWSQSDPEWNKFNRFYIEVYRENGTLFWDTGWSCRQDTAYTTNGYAVPTDLPTGETLKARMMVTDHDDNMWSDWSDWVYFKLNFPPSAVVTSPSGTQANPTIMGPKPLIEWTMADPDPNTVFSAYQLKILSEDGLTAYVDTGKVGINTDSTSGSYQVQTDLPQGVKAQVAVKVWDQDGTASWWSQVKWLFTNRPPAADFDWSPKPLWEGDPIRLFSLSTDPDGNSLSYRWTIQAPGGEIEQGTGVEWRGAVLLPGNYSVRLEAFDGYARHETTKQVQVLPLTIQSDVRHTPEWLEHHRTMGHQTEEHPKDFYSGERLLVSIRAASAPVTEAAAWLEATGMDGAELRLEAILENEPDDPLLWTGELYDEKLSSLTGRLPDGEFIIHFRLIYANGVEKLQEIPIRIVGSVFKAVQVHRVQ